jgi:hypothetical protein
MIVTRTIQHLVFVLALFACNGGGGGGGGGDDAPEPDAPTVQPDAPPAVTAPNISTVQCGPLPPTGPGNVAEFQKHVLDMAVFPDAVCNDGTPAVIYFRPYSGAANRNKWIVNLHGGGGCNGGKSCLARWCNCSNTTECPFTTAPTNFTRLTMTNAGPNQKAADGVFHRGGTGAETNPYGNYNQVEFSYCSSDSWQGAVRDLAMDAPHPKTGVPTEFSIHFLGARILDGDLATLRQAGVPPLVYTLGGVSTMMPDLDDATEIIVTGDSAGGAGVIANLDHITTSLRASNVNGAALKTYGLIDAVVGPDRSKLDYGTFIEPTVRSYDAFLTLVNKINTAANARRDASCLSFHSGDPRACDDDSHVLRHHITTPFFVRMALRDFLITEGYIDAGFRNPDMSPMTPGSFALTLHAELSQFASMLTATPGPEEKSAMTVAPGVFAPGCVKHDTIHSNLETYYTTITPPGGTPLRLFQVFEPWRTGGSPTSILTQSTTLADTNCP